MKKTIILSIILFLGLTLQAFAVPAKPGKITAVQPDGTTITIQVHGDEFYHWITNESGDVVAPDKKGFYHVSEMPVGEFMGGRERAFEDAERIRLSRAAKTLSPGVKTAVKQDYHYPVVLVEFNDVKFTSETPADDFNNLLNQEDYSANGATGSAHDYYYDNSMGYFNATFHVMGPYSFNGNTADYAEHAHAAQILWETITAHDSEVDWSIFDNDNDGYVDMVFLCYAGHNKAEGAANTIWPHKWDFRSAYSNLNKSWSGSRMDGKSFSTYACTSELRGSTGTTMCGIGTFCHEFAHTLGLPDFYDTNYNNYNDGEAGATYYYDVMCSGSYNNNGRTPPFFTGEERIMMGWMDAYAELPSSGSITLEALNGNHSYKMNSATTNEYFVFEARGGKWDAYLQPGMVVYHVDKSSLHSVSVGTSYGTYSFTAAELWSSQRSYINACGSHPCYYIIPAADQSNLDYSGSSANLPFPGLSSVTYFSPVDWSGMSYDIFSNIAYNDSDVSVSMVRSANHAGLQGTVTDVKGNTVPGATVNIYYAVGMSVDTAPVASGPERISARMEGQLRQTTVTDENGYYTLDLSGVEGSVDVEVVAKGYVTHYESVTIGSSIQTKDFVLRSASEPLSYTLRKYSDGTSLRYVGFDNISYAKYAAVHYTANELLFYVGRKVKALNFKINLSDSPTYSGSGTGIYGIIEIGDTRVLTSQLSASDAQGDGWYRLDLSESGIVIPSGSDCYFGYALAGGLATYAFAAAVETDVTGGFFYNASTTSSVSSSSESWHELTEFGNLLISVELDDSVAFDYTTISDPGYGRYSVGDTFVLALNEASGDLKPASAVSWFLDDEPVSAGSIVLSTAGTHVVEARFTNAAGRKTVLETRIVVE